ncbi:MAG TPA: hypothetical protein VK997_06000 [Deferrisomatales bacterium]|nr:hypothetical protein [Deferrisomatales bacterium]
MPLSFPSLSHGAVAFGFYNIETDGLLLEDQFFFATEFGTAVEQLARVGGEQPAAGALDGHRFRDRAAIGDLMGAIHGVRLVGYLGEIYGMWPFPAAPEAFRQKLKGHENRAATQAALDRFAERTRIPLTAEPGFGRVTVGPYAFSGAGFVELLRYVVRGGYPTWEDCDPGALPASARRLQPVIETLTAHLS